MYFIKFRCGDVSPFLATLISNVLAVSLFIVQLRFLSNNCFQNTWRRFTFCAAKSGRPSLNINMLIIQLRGPNTWSLLGISRWTLRKLHRWTQHIQSIWAEFAVICSSWTALLVQTSKKKCMICMELYYTRSHAYTIYGLFHVALLAAAANGTKLCNVRSWLTRILPRNKRRFRCVISGSCSKPAKKFAGTTLWHDGLFVEIYNLFERICGQKDSRQQLWMPTLNPWPPEESVHT